MTTVLIELANIRKSYGGQDGTPAVEVLHSIDLSIGAGEFIAIVGASGSGKSTLMHILGCLDQPSSGSYRFAGKDIAAFSADQLAQLRREAFGFVFQGYHLIPTLDASHNVQVPAVYAGVDASVRSERSASLLTRLGLGERLDYFPKQLSGGQQQRISIARALMNGGQVILADEPTGALDSATGMEVMKLLSELAEAGHTVILITHDLKVAAQAKRVVRIHDGRIVEDRIPVMPDSIRHPEGTSHGSAVASSSAVTGLRVQPAMTDSGHAIGLAEAFASAWRTLWVSRFRTLLTLLGIVIGVASVIVLMAVGKGSSEATLSNLAAFGSVHRVQVWPDTDPNHGQNAGLSLVDVETVREVANVQAIVPFNPQQGLLVAGEQSFSTWILATGSEGMEVFNLRMQSGSYITREDEEQMAAVVVLGIGTRGRLFPDESINPLGQYIQINGLPFRVIGVLQETGDDEEDNTVMVPFASAAHRLWGSQDAGAVQLRVGDLAQLDQTVIGIGNALELARGARDFRVFNDAVRVRAQNEASRQQALLLSLIAGISLIVGGIGVMNIMLMSVKERTREIGIRMATGARQSDIQRQFLSEAVVVSLTGGAIGLVLGMGIGAVLMLLGVPVVFSVRAMLLAFGCALATGLVFGWMPARAAARLRPVAALAGE
ncbi:ABC transporter permease [Lampropedia hyalina]|nr:ABC transporter permease [Lampropedia hyalina]